MGKFSQEDIVDIPPSVHIVDEGEHVDIAETGDCLDLSVVNLPMNPAGERLWTDFAISNLASWSSTMVNVIPDPKKLPAILSMQDNLGPNMKDDVAELDCLREEWMNKLFPEPSSYEDPDTPLRTCMAPNVPKRLAQSKARAGAMHASTSKQELRLRPKFLTQMAEELKLRI